MSEAILSLGSNLGNRIFNVKEALESIKRIPETNILKISNFYETEPFGVKTSQNKYINCCVKISTQLSPEILMGCCLGIEAAMKRVREYKFSPRTIDIDILAYEKEIRNEKNLTLPHPEMLKRAFVLAPLKEVCDGTVFKNIDFTQNLKKCDLSTIKKLI